MAYSFLNQSVDTYNPPPLTIILNRMVGTKRGTHQFNLSNYFLLSLELYYLDCCNKSTSAQGDNKLSGQKRR